MNGYPPSLHELRIAIKRLRYALEFFGAMLPGKSGKMVIKRLAALQEVWGNSTTWPAPAIC
ncbi:MAG: CHAD domain-containing protein [Rhodocyclales bacterium]|nr:CHAD domain-containing protein [Rhodocyclales bacterium]